MSIPDAVVQMAQADCQRTPEVRFPRGEIQPRRTEPFDISPGFYEPAGLWLYGNARLLRASLAHVEAACGHDTICSQRLAEIEAEAEGIVFEGKVLVCGCHNDAHRRAAVVPLRWGAPRILILSGGFNYHLGADLKQEPFRLARLWRYQWDPVTDLAVSRRAPDRLPTFAHHNPTVDRMIALIARGQWVGPAQSASRVPAVLLPG